jgi:hypothetical protein
VVLKVHKKLSDREREKLAEVWSAATGVKAVVVLDPEVDLVGVVEDDGEPAVLTFRGLEGRGGG